MTKERLKFGECTIWKPEKDDDNFYYRWVSTEPCRQKELIDNGYEMVPIETQAKQGATSANKTG